MNAPATILGLTAASASLGFGQGFIEFNNHPLALPSPPDRLVRFQSGQGVIGTQFVAQLFYASDAPSRDTSLDADAAVVEVPSPFRPVTTTLPGVWEGATRRLVGTAPGETGTFVVRAWDSGFGDGSYGAAWREGGMIGQSATFEYRVPLVALPPDAFFMLNFVGFTIDVVPEPSTLVLSIVGGLGIVYWIRQR